MDSNLHVFRKITNAKVEIKIKTEKYSINYPQEVWNKFPKSLHRVFADSLAYIATWYLPLFKDVHLNYHFPHPLIEPTFFKILLYAIPMNVSQLTNTTTSELIKKFYNYNFNTNFKALNGHYSGKKIKKRLKQKAILLFSFGKESLLTFGILQELGVATIPVFVKEPQSPYENTNKGKLTQKFYKETGIPVNFFPLPIGNLRQEEDSYWGWDINLSQYIFILIPYLFYYQAKYLFLGNEQSCNSFIKNEEGYFVNPVFEQSLPAMQLLQDIPKIFSIDSHIGSIVEPIHEIFITYILHHRYPELGKFQTSCFSERPEARKNRWCGHCEKCARMYIFFKALGINPESVGFNNQHMLSRKKKSLYMLFNPNKAESAYAESGLGREEQLLAFYLAYKNGTKGSLISNFASLYLKEAEKKKKKLFNKYFGLHTSYSLPPGLRRKIIKIYAKERESLAEYLEKLIN